MVLASWSCFKGFREGLDQYLFWHDLSIFMAMFELPGFSCKRCTKIPFNTRTFAIDCILLGKIHQKNEEMVRFRDGHTRMPACKDISRDWFWFASSFLLYFYVESSQFGGNRWTISEVESPKNSLLRTESLSMVEWSSSIYKAYKLRTMRRFLDLRPVTRSTSRSRISSAGTSI